MHCPLCRTDNPADASFCEQCGAKLELVCPACKTALSQGARFCKKCGTETKLQLSHDTQCSPPLSSPLQRQVDTLGKCLGGKLGRLATRADGFNDLRGDNRERGVHFSRRLKIDPP
jgi:hypothetical protein